MKKRPGTGKLWLFAWMTLARHRPIWTVPVWLALAACALPCRAQNTITIQEPGAAQNATAPEPPGPSTTVHGVVTNAATGAPLERALVTVFGDPQRGALTDNEGRFELHGIRQGQAAFMVSKPGFEDALNSDEGEEPLSILVSDTTPELSLSLVPQNSISGHIALSTGLPAQDFGVALLRQMLMNGHAAWNRVNGQNAKPDGSFRFGNLSAGTYLVRSQPELENRSAATSACSAHAPEPMPGYAAVFSNGAADLAGAEPLTIKDGQSAEVNLALTQVPFHRVRIAIGGAASGADTAVRTTLLDGSGQESYYSVHVGNHALCAYLPDCSYTLVVRVSRNVNVMIGGPGGTSLRIDYQPGASGGGQTGVLEFSVSGQAVTNLRVALGPAASTPVHARYVPGPPKPNPGSGQAGSQVSGNVEVVDTLNITAARVNLFQPFQNRATRESETEYELGTLAPGAYWISATAVQDGVCVGAVTAGGENLANHPWVVRENGTGAPIDVELRTDCAKLTVSLPAGAAVLNPAGNSVIYVYAVPESDTADEVERQQINPLFDNGSAIISNLPPGKYKVYAARTRQPLEYHNPAAMEKLGTGQEVELEPNGEATLMLEGVPQ
jgi:hypothetical protein